MRLAHISDTHLGYRQYNLDERENDFYEAFNQAIDRVIEERADVLIHSGDLFESPQPTVKALYTLKGALEKLDGRVKIFTVLGDHDMPRRRGMPPHKLFDLRIMGIGNLDWEVIDGVLIAGISNLKGRRTVVLKEELKKFDRIAEKYKHSILIAHQAIERYLPFEGAYELKEDDLPREATYYALGHLHSRLKVRFGKGYLAYSGSTEINTKDEISSWNRDGKGFYLVDLEGDEPEIHEINLDIRPQIKVEAEEEKLEEALKDINYPKPPVVHITVRGEMIDRRFVMEELRRILSNKVLTYKVYFREIGRELEELPSDGELNLRTILEEYFGNEKLAKLAMELYGHLSEENNIEEAIKTAEEFMGEKNDY